MTAADPSPARRDAVRAEQLRLVLEGVAQSVAVGVVVAAVMVIVLWPFARRDVLVGWFALFATERGSAALFARAALRRPRSPASDRRDVRVLGASKVVEGAIWGSLLLIGLPLQVAPVSILLMSLMGAVCGNGVSLLSPLRRLYLALALPLAALAVVALWGLGGLAYRALAFCSVLYVVGQYGQVVLASRRTEEAIRLRFTNLELVEQLQAETDAARAARADAERANAAKSRFLAAASHDLRQPVHALGLFLEALRRTELAPAQQRMVASAQAAGFASTDMLNTLLDFSRLEAGVVTARPQPFALQTLLQKLERELGPLADEKGLGYRTSQREATVCSDPGLLELILRNLLLNAIRYTERGGLLIGLRRRGPSVSIEVYDTGVGIAPDQHEAVFTEFHQLGNPERDRSKGLGLGLAIVRGLATRLGHPLSLASVVGRGTVFRLLVPVAQAGHDAATTTASKAGADAVAGRTVLIIDDDPAVREAMLDLLARWRAYGLAAEGWKDAAQLCPAGQAPDMVVCDYRLREGETGSDVVERLRKLWGADTPALLVTGDTAPERLREAAASGVPLLHKPVAPDTLFSGIVRSLYEQTTLP